MVYVYCVPWNLKTIIRHNKNFELLDIACALTCSELDEGTLNFDLLSGTHKCVSLHSLIETVFILYSTNSYSAGAGNISCCL